MFGSISEDTAIRTVSEVANNNLGNPAAKDNGAAKFEVADPASADSVSVATGQERNNLFNTGSYDGKNEVKQGEVRKSEVTDGELKTRVYDCSGKLLRVIPPGYLPVGEQKFDVTI